MCEEPEDCTNCDKRIKKGRRFGLWLDDDEISVQITGVFCSKKCAKLWIEKVLNIEVDIYYIYEIDS